MSNSRPRRGSRTAGSSRSRLRESRPPDAPLLEFADRSLHGSHWLYAQRLVANYPQFTMARWYSAYAWAWGGAQHALADLAQLAEPASGTAPGRRRPGADWCRPIVTVIEVPWHKLPRSPSRPNPGRSCCNACSLDAKKTTTRCLRCSRKSRSMPTAYVTYVDAVHYSTASEPSMLGTPGESNPLDEWFHKSGEVARSTVVGPVVGSRPRDVERILRGGRFGG